MIRFAMRNVWLRQFAVVTAGVTAADIGSMRVFLSFVPDAPGHRVTVVTRYELVRSEDADGKKPPAAVAEVACRFEVEASGWDEEVGTGEGAAIPKWMLDLFAVHTVGTARGMIYAKAEDTSLRGFIIQPVDVGGLIKGPLALGKDAVNSADK